MEEKVLVLALNFSSQRIWVSGSLILALEISLRSTFLHGFLPLFSQTRARKLRRQISDANWKPSKPLDWKWNWLSIRWFRGACECSLKSNFFAIERDEEANYAATWTDLFLIKLFSLTPLAHANSLNTDLICSHYKPCSFSLSIYL
jgi:hypothetical protein